MGGGDYVSTNIELAELDYAAGMKYKDIAEKYEVSINTVKSWKTRNKWVRKGVHTKSKSMHTKKEKGCTQNKGSDVDNKLRKSFVNLVAENDELTEQQKLFCLYFTKSPNATQSYMNAFDAKRNTAMVEGWKLLRNPKIKSEIDKLRQIKYESIMFDVNDLVERQMRIAFASMTDFLNIEVKEIPRLHSDGTEMIDKDGNVAMLKLNQVFLKESSEIDGDLISEVKEGTDGNVSLKLKDSTKAMDWLTKYFELNPQDKHKVAFDNAKLDIERKKAAMNDADKENATVVKLVIDEP